MPIRKGTFKVVKKVTTIKPNGSKEVKYVPVEKYKEPEYRLDIKKKRVVSKKTGKSVSLSEVGGNLTEAIKKLEEQEKAEARTETKTVVKKETPLSEPEKSKLETLKDLNAEVERRVREAIAKGALKGKTGKAREEELRQLYEAFSLQVQQELMEKQPDFYRVELERGKQRTRLVASEGFLKKLQEMQKQQQENWQRKKEAIDHIIKPLTEEQKKEIETKIALARTFHKASPVSQLMFGKELPTVIVTKPIIQQEPGKWTPTITDWKTKQALEMEILKELTPEQKRAYFQKKQGLIERGVKKAESFFETFLSAPPGATRVTEKQYKPEEDVLGRVVMGPPKRFMSGLIRGTTLEVAPLFKKEHWKPIFKSNLDLAKKAEIGILRASEMAGMATGLWVSMVKAPQVVEKGFAKATALAGKLFKEKRMLSQVKGLAKAYKMSKPLSRKKIAFELAKKYSLPILGYTLTGVYAYETGKTISEQIRLKQYGEAGETALKSIAFAKLSGSAIKGAIKGWAKTRPSLEESLKRFKAKTRLEMGQAKEAIAEVGGKQAGASIQTFQYRTTVRIPQKGKLRTLTIGKTTGKSKVLSLGPKGAYKIEYEWKFGPLRGKGVEAGKLKLENVQRGRIKFVSDKGVDTILKEKAIYESEGVKIEQYKNLAEARFKDLFKRRSFENLPTYINIEKVREKLTSLGEIPLGKSLRPTKQLVLGKDISFYVAKEEKGRAKAILSETDKRLTEVEIRFKKTPDKELTATQTEREILVGLKEPRTAIFREYSMQTLTKPLIIQTEKPPTTAKPKFTKVRAIGEKISTLGKSTIQTVEEKISIVGKETQETLQTITKTTLKKIMPKKMPEILSKVKLIKSSQRQMSAPAFVSSTALTTEKSKEAVAKVKQKPVEIEVIKTGETKKIRLTLTKFRELLKKKFGFAPPLEEIKEKITKAKEKTIEKSKQGEKAFEKIIEKSIPKLRTKTGIKEKVKLSERMLPKESLIEKTRTILQEKLKIAEKQQLKPKTKQVVKAKLISKQLLQLKQKLVPKIKYRALTTQMPIPFLQTPKIPYISIPPSFGFVGRGKRVRRIKIKIKGGKPFLKPFADLISIERMDRLLAKSHAKNFVAKHPTTKQFYIWLEYFKKIKRLPTKQELLKLKRRKKVKK